MLFPHFNPCTVVFFTYCVGAINKEKYMDAQGESGSSHIAKLAGTGE